ncbi:Diadenosine tetraphosphate (Ap4A) hydrolase [Nitrosomonas nitrosa]|uniref:Diadenosine tetraphosphate (Ap4A) hydrolase n=1 Tax=Nitrosomonas nitrosa TaxID=52442 RepID=A0A8H8Z280_9PROT|nr:HIT family protein [Nitrosomonas nitrosa]CAE6509199.1 Diadenosine tetraphosphate (Ap4A) hydrolase [Nitrosomonas nitrosa]
MAITVFNGTMQKFGAPDTVIHQYDHWSVLLRPAQLTLGALVLVAHEPVHAFSELSPASFVELHQVTGQIESALQKAFQYDKLNYLMLMMVDPDVHFHVIPRYAQAISFNDRAFVDAGWPAVPNFGQINDTDSATRQLIIERIKACWERGA